MLNPVNASTNMTQENGQQNFFTRLRATWLLSAGHLVAEPFEEIPEDLPPNFLKTLVEARDTAEMSSLFAKFLPVFGNEGETQVGKAMRLLGNGIPELNVKGYRGVKGESSFILSTPLMGYVMRRALRTDTAAEAYTTYIANVKYLLEERNKEIRQENESIRSENHWIKIQKIWGGIINPTADPEEQGSEDEELPEIPYIYLQEDEYPSLDHIDLITEAYLNRLDNIRYTNQWKKNKPLNGTDLDPLVKVCMEASCFRSHQDDLMKKDRKSNDPNTLSRRDVRQQDAEYLTILLAKAALHLTHNRTLDADQAQSVANDLTAYLRFARNNFDPREEASRLKELQLDNDRTVQVPEDVKQDIKRLIEAARTAALDLPPHQMDMFDAGQVQANPAAQP